MSRLFISHSTQDRAWVERELLGLISSLGLEPWFAEDDITTAEQWRRSIHRGLEQSRWFLLVMSRRTAASEWVKDELNWAIGNREGFIVPLLIDDCDPHDFHLRLARIQRIDFRRDTRRAREKLIALLVQREYCSIDNGEDLYPGIDAVIQASDLPMYFTDNDFIIRFFNKRLTMLLGFKENELAGQSVAVIVDRFISLAPEHRRSELQHKQNLLGELGLPDHCEEDDLIDLRHMVGNRYQGIQRVWISADRVYHPITKATVGHFLIFRPHLIEQ